MGSFIEARRQHKIVASGAAENAEVAADLWNAITGRGAAPLRDSFAEAVADTVPEDRAALLAMDDVAVAFAFGLMWDGSRCLPPGAQPFELRDLARDQWARFEEQASKTEDLASGFGWDLQMAWAHTRAVQLAQGDMAMVERIARLAGRMYIALRGAQARKVHGVPSEVYSVEQGNDIARLLPTEQVLLTDALLELVTLERIASRRAAQYAVRGTSRVSKGPLVIAIDESGSMSGQRNEWAKAAAVALARVAMAERRPVAVVHFSTSAVVQHLPPGDADAMIKMIQHFLGRGTAIGLALGVAVQQVRELALKGHKGADILLVTDGVDGDVAAHHSAMRDAHNIGARLWTIAIECEISEMSPLRKLAASYTRLGTSDLHDRSVTVLVGAA